MAFREDRPISARQPLFFETMIRWSRRNPLPAALMAVSLLLLTLVAVSATVGFLSTMDALNKERHVFLLQITIKPLGRPNIGLLNDVGL